MTAITAITSNRHAIGKNFPTSQNTRKNQQVLAQ
jgi:hypothetical protein